MKILELIEDAGADSEEESDRNGFLSWSAEWHAAQLGFSHGARDPWSLAPDGLPQGDTEHEIDARDESAYYYGAFVTGTLSQLALLGLAAYFGKGFLGF